MANEKIANEIFDAVAQICDKRIAQISFDKTLTMNIIEILGNNFYKARYENTVYTVYSEGLSNYELDTSVYVLIPSGDPDSAYKRIIGKVRELDSEDGESTTFNRFNQQLTVDSLVEYIMELEARIDALEHK